MTPLQSTHVRPPPAAIQSAIDHYGAKKVLLAALRALLRPKARPPDPAHLSEHMRRDVGLPPKPADANWIQYTR